MYRNYFGFRERPFQLVPNPAYLFLSRSHEEAMAHLTYAVKEGEGFITIIGEVGTGKTTLCRAFIESLDDHVEVAYIFNPKLTAIELLKSVCDEFGIGGTNEYTTKDLIDVLNRFLMEKREAGRRVMLIIDEAQNLSREVLEQIRLLSNLETNTEKLLQIVLAGQPEMGDLLDSHELRQLSQRITLSCNLMPLTYPESVQYIRHRVRIAARKDIDLFSTTAFRKIHTFSKGIPRLIHIVCDRALLIAYVTNREKATGAIVDSAIRELKPRSMVDRLRAVETRKTLLLAGLLCLLVYLLFTVAPMNSDGPTVRDMIQKKRISSDVENPGPPSSPDNSLKRQPPSSEPGAMVLKNLPASIDSPPSLLSASPGNEDVQTSPLAQYLRGIGRSESQESALSGALTLWGKKPPLKEHPNKEWIDPEDYLHLTARENGFLIHRIQGDLENISNLNLPAILEFRPPAGAKEPRYLTLSRMDETHLVFLTEGGGHLDADPGDMAELWTGVAHIPWKNFSDCGGIIPIDAGAKDVLVLKELLGKIGYSRLIPDPVYDVRTKAAVLEIQKKHGLPVDGLVGPLTKIVLYNDLPGLAIPHIRNNDTGPTSME